MIKSFQKNKLLSIVYLWVYIFSIIYAINKLSQNWGYYGIHFFPPNFTTILLILLFSTIPYFYVPKKLSYPSQFITIYIYFLIYIPACIVPFFIIPNNLFLNDYYYFLIIMLLGLVYLLHKPRNDSRSLLKLLVFKTEPINKKFVFPLFSLLYLFITLSFISVLGLKFTIPNFEDIYAVRAQFKETASDNLLVGYFINWMGYIINIFVILYGLSIKNKKIILFGILYQLYIFSLLALKSHVAVMLLVIILFYFFKYKKSLSIQRILFYLSIFVVTIILLDIIIGTDFLQSVILRRILIEPSQLNYYHFEFFTSHPKTYWAHSILKNFSKYPYNLPPPNLIAREYFNKPEMTSVVNMFAEGYTAFGYLGTIIIVLLLKVILRTLDYIFIKSGKNIIILIMVISLSNVISSASLFTILLTHGWMLLLLLLLYFPWGGVVILPKNKIM